MPTVKTLAILVNPTARRAAASDSSVLWSARVAAGGLMSYGANLSESYGLMGIYAGRISFATVAGAS